MSLKLQLKRDDEPEPTNACPSCGADMPPSAVICIECGYDTRTGRRSGEENRRKLSPAIIFALVLAVVGAGATIALRVLNSSSDTLPPPSPSQQAPAPTAETPAPSAPDTPAPASPEASATAPAATEAVAAASAEAPAAEPEPEPEPPAIDWAAVEAEQLEKANEELDRRAPLYEAGEAIELRLTNGIIVRGVFKGLRNGEVTLAVAEDDVRELPIESMDRQNRVRTEADYRQRYVEFVVKRRIAEMMQRASTNAP
ncbi:MAG: zinc ribbon domain-containing protein [Kiritimatiellae bacterium]|nr:zinc ribbon domain-containing protein [Kiritimatiellia bacterium]